MEKLDNINDGAIQTVEQLADMFLDLRDIQAAITRIKQQADADRAAVDRYEKKQLAPLEEKANYIHFRLTEYQQKQLESNPKAPKTLVTTFGKVKATTSKAQPEKVSDSDLMAYAKVSRPEFVERVFEDKLKWGELKKTLSIIEHGEQLIVVDSDGEIVPGVSIKPKTTTFKVEVSDL